MNADAIKSNLNSAFVDVTKPMAIELISHDCPECNELRDELSGYLANEVPDSVMDKHCWSLPLLSDDGKQYFLPAWMLRSIDDPHSDFTESLLFEFAGEHRWAPKKPYSIQQRASIEIFLHYLVDRINPMYQHELNEALKRWTNEP